ncbi:MAG: methylenetetrahydrofolate reductase [Candidatus Eisenbacteria bacterium]|nr:methylenetetrahydrofolate reductase [Candidatus Eisenbacteria bacterium]
MERTFKDAIESGRFIVTGELGPPMGASDAVVRKKAAHFRGVVDAVNTTDNQSGIVRMSSIAAAAILLDEGLDPIVQVTCRDRNRIALQSDMLGASALGVRNLLLLTGDHMTMGNHPDAKPVYDMDSVQLIGVADELRKGAFMCGDEVKSPPGFLLGGAANPFAEPMGLRIIRIAKKARAGADFIQTQAIFDASRFRRWMEGVRDLGLHRDVKILAGILPTRSHKALEYMRDNVAGMTVPESLIERLRGAEDREAEGVRIACELVEEVRAIEGVAGVHLMPVMWEKITPRLVEEAGL